MKKYQVLSKGKVFASLDGFSLEDAQARAEFRFDSSYEDLSVQLFVPKIDLIGKRVKALSNISDKVNPYGVLVEIVEVLSINPYRVLFENEYTLCVSEIEEADSGEIYHKPNSLEIKKGYMVELESGEKGIIIKYPSNKEISIQLPNEIKIVNKSEIIKVL